MTQIHRCRLPSYPSNRDSLLSLHEAGIVGMVDVARVDRIRFIVVERLGHRFLEIIVYFVGSVVAFISIMAGTIGLFILLDSLSANVPPMKVRMASTNGVITKFSGDLSSSELLAELFVGDRVRCRYEMAQPR
jgi:hypothetical protein